MKNSSKNLILSVVRISLLTAYCSMLTVFLHAAFEPVPVGARPSGLGGAYTAISDDVYSVYYNPAGLAFMQRAEFTAQYSQMYIGLWDNSNLSYSFLGVAQPLSFNKNYGTLGISWLSFNSGGLYKENSLIVSYGKNLRATGEKGLSLGLNLKYLSLGYGQDDYTNNALNDDGMPVYRTDSLFENYGYSKTQLTADIGVQYFLFTNYKLGITLGNITSPNLALNPQDSANLPATYNIGMAHMGENYLLGIEFMTRQVNELSDTRISVAGEKYFPMGIGIRSSLIMGSREMMDLAVGLGYKTGELQIDYALEYPISGIKSTFGNHKISMILRFGPMVPMLSEDTMKLQKQLKLTEDQLQSAKLQIEELKTKIYSMLNAPAQKLPQPPEPKKPAPVKVQKSEQAILESQYENEFNEYRAEAEKLAFIERLRKIKTIVNSYKNRKVDISSAQDEYKLLINEQSTQEASYRSSMSYYKKMAEREIDKKTATDILNKIIKKYEPYGLDLSEAQDGLKKLQ